MSTILWISLWTKASPLLRFFFFFFFLDKTNQQKLKGKTQTNNLGSREKNLYVAHKWAPLNNVWRRRHHKRNNELFLSLLHFLKSVPNFRAKNHDATARDVRLQCRRRRLSRSERRRCPRGTRRPAGVARCAILILSLFFLFRVKNVVGEFWLRFVSRGYFFARCGRGRCG